MQEIASRLDLCVFSASVTESPDEATGLKNPTRDSHCYSNSKLVVWVVGLTILFELMTCVLRFGIQFETTRDTASTIGQLTCGLRIHHSYIGGLIMLVACWLWERFPRLAWWGLVLGLSLFSSDLIHHFLVLWPITGSPQFDLLYPIHP